MELRVKIDTRVYNKCYTVVMMSDDFPKKKRKKPTKPDFSGPVDLSGMDHVPPHNLDAERGVIGALLLDPMLCDDIVPLVGADDFYSDAHRRIFKHLVEMRGDNSGIDLLLLLNRLQASEELELIGGEAYLAELMSSVHVAAHAEYYANIVRDKAMLRRLIHLGSGVVREAFSPDTPTKDLLNKASNQMFELCESQTTNQITDMKGAMDAAVSYLDAIMTNQSDAVPTGFVDLDKVIDGLHPNELVILAARPSMGKTALAMNIAEHVAVDAKMTTLVVSLEMAVRELAMRMICSRGRINSYSIRKGILSSNDNKKFLDVVNELSYAPMFIDDTSTRTVSEIAAIARRLKRQNDLRLIVIDYIGLIEPENPHDPRQEQVAKIARRLKGLARELKVPILCLAQLSRQAEANAGPPKLSHLRESGAIEQDADVVMFIHREEKNVSEEEAVKRELLGKAEVIVAKQRNGETKPVKVTWIGEYTRFENYSEHNPYEDPALSEGYTGYEDF